MGFGAVIRRCGLVHSFKLDLGGALRPPELEWNMTFCVDEVFVRGEQGELMPPAQLNQERINRSNLNA